MSEGWLEAASYDVLSVSITIVIRRNTFCSHEILDLKYRILQINFFKYGQNRLTSSQSICFDQWSQMFSDAPGTKNAYGQLSVQIDIYIHPGTGERRVTVKGKKYQNADNFAHKNIEDNFQLIHQIMSISICDSFMEKVESVINCCVSQSSQPFSIKLFSSDTAAIDPEM